MSGNAMRLKAKIRNLAKDKGMSAQVVLQNYMFERFLVRLSKSEYKDQFILKGGILIATLVGIHNRATMDMDTTVKNLSLNVEDLTKAIHEICRVEMNDNIFFIMTGIEAIRPDDQYGGYRVNIQAVFDTIKTPLQLDVTTGDVITPKEILYSFPMIFGEGKISIWAYNMETVLAEKVETILQRGELNTRPRDFYDVYILTKTQDFDPALFLKALKSTTEHRKTSLILDNISDRVERIEKSNILKSRWMKYTEDYKYAEKITYDQIMKSFKMLVQNFE